MRAPIFTTLLLTVATSQLRATPASHAQGDDFALEAARLLPQPEPMPAAATVPPELSSQLGQWGAVFPWTPHIPVTVANLPDGRLLSFASNQRTTFPVGAEFTYAATWNPANGQFVEYNNPNHDMFCGAPVMLPDGRVMVSGGRNNTVRNSIFDWRTNTWTRNADMNGGRWYNTAVALPDGQVFTVTGWGSGEMTSERWNRSSWSVLTGLPWNSVVAEPGYATNWHPYITVAPDGRLLHFGPSDTMHWLSPLGSGSIVNTGTTVPGAHYPKEGTWLMYEEGRIVVVGGGASNVVNPNEATAGASTNLAYTVNLNTTPPTIATTGSMTHSRQYAAGVVLPSGEVLIMGGNTSGLKFSDLGSIMPCEIWNPRNGTWRVVSSISVPRNYHSTAILLKDGRVYLGGSGLSGGPTDHQDAQIYTPPGLFTNTGAAAPRPSISAAPAAVNVGATFNVTASTDIVQFACIKLSATTHSINTDLRRLVLDYSEPTPGNYVVRAHANVNVMTPGYWMLFGLNAGGAWSTAATIRVDAGVPPILSNPGTQTGTIGTPVSLALTAVVPAGIVTTWSASGLPSGLSINATSGLITGTPAALTTATVTATATAGGLSHGVTFTWTIAPAGSTGGVLYERWLGIPGETLPAILNSALYPNSPTEVSTLPSFETPTNWGENHAQRVRGWLRPTVSGAYQFWIASDDEGRLQLSTDDKPENAVTIARVPVWAGVREWTKFPEQTSALINLVAGRAYFIDAIMKEGDGGDNLAVAWRAPGGVQEVIPGSFLSLTPSVIANLPPTLTNPGSQTTTRGVAVNLALSAADPESAPLTFSATGLPAGLSIAPATGGISGTVTTTGTSNVAVSVSDGVNAPVAINFTWTVNSPIQITLAGKPPALAGTVVSVSASSTGGTAPTYRWSWGDGTADSPATASAAASHTWATPGRYRVVITVTDASGITATAQYYQGVHAPLTARRPGRSTSITFEDRATGNDRVWVVNPDNNSVTAFDSVTRTRLAEIPTAGGPRSLAVAPDGRIWVTNTSPASISIINPTTLAIAATVALPRASAPFGLAFDPDGTDAWVACEGSGQVLRLNPANGARVAEFNAGLHARHLAISADSARLYVSRFITPRLPGESTGSITTSATVGGEIPVYATGTLALERTIILQHSERTDSPAFSRGIPNYLGALAISPDGLSAWVPSKQDNIKRGQLRDGNQLAHDLTVRSIASRISLAAGAPAVDDLTARIDHDNAGVATSSVFDPSGVYLFTTLEGNRAVAVCDAMTRRELLRIDVGRAPQGITLSPDGRTLFVQNFMDRTVGVYNVSSVIDGLETPPPTLGTLAAIATERLTPSVLLGKQLFYDASDSRVSFQQYLSCAACHHEGAEDGRVWDFTGMGEGLRNTISLRGRSGTGHGPVHWTGNFDEIQDFENQIRSLSRGTGLLAAANPHASLGAPNAGRSPDLDALAAYVSSLTVDDASPHRLASGALTAEAQTGKTIFAAKNCASCHSGANFTNSALNSFRNIGTIKPASGTRLSAPLTGLDVPTLRGLWNSPPYLHDGSAPTLAAAVTAHQGLSITPSELTSLVAYLQQVDPAETTAPAPAVPVASNGLKGEYFNGRTFNTPVLTRTDADINFEWAGASPAAGIDVDNFSARWSGEILPAYSEEYTFFIVGDNGRRLSVNGLTLVNQWNPAAGDDGGWHSGKVTLTAGVRVPISIDYYEAFGGAGVVLYWFSATQGWEVVPSSRLFTGGSGVDTTRPGVTLSTPASGAITGPVTITVAFTESVTGLTLSDFTATSATLSALTGSGAAYTLTLTPASAATSGSLSLPASAAADAAGNLSTASNTLSLTFTQNQAPSVSLAAQSISRGQVISVQPTGSDPEGQALTWSASGLPPGLSINATSGRISGTVTSAATGSYNSLLGVRDPAGLTGSRNVVWTVVTASPGLQATYYNGRNFETQVLSRVDAGINFDWGSAAPAPGVNADNFSVRWAGTLTPAYSETYTITIPTDNGVRLWVNNVLLIDKFTDDVTGWFNATVALTANTPAAIRIEYKEEYGGAGITVYWHSATQAWETLPTARLSTASGGGALFNVAVNPDALKIEAARIASTLQLQPLPGGDSFDVVFTIPADSRNITHTLERSLDLRGWRDQTANQQRFPLPDGRIEVRTTIIGGARNILSEFFRVRLE